MIQKVFNKKGNVATLWVASLPVFALLFMVVGSLVVAWMSHSSSQVAADAASLAATQKLDGWVRQGLAEKMRQLDGGAYGSILGSDEQKQAFMREVVRRHEQQLKAVAKKYAEKNGAKGKGRIILSSNGRVEVEAGTPFRSLIFEDYFKDYEITGSGTGPSRYYLDWLPNKAIEVTYE
ncbi:pilus assembly protein TadG-related protein [Salinithrix halophila]|uniref:Pilus assembly protein TadG-related protein n=1 Tax=Salinithrix halophila TaxID=1485204 RepID=A0ABV8JE33_9BACL